MKVYLITDQNEICYGIFSNKQSAIANAEKIAQYNVCLYIKEFMMDKQDDVFIIWNSWDYMA